MTNLKVFLLAVTLLFCHIVDKLQFFEFKFVTPGGNWLNSHTIMLSLENFESLVENLKNFNGFTRSLVDFATGLGIVLTIVYTIKLSAEAYKGFRLYVWSQMFCRVNFREKYGQWVVITGATDGIGLSMAKEFARRGLSIMVVGRNKEKLASTKLLLEAEANVGQVLTVEIDLSDSSMGNYQRIQREIDPDNRDIGILVNNAGFLDQDWKRFYRFSMETLRTTVNVNVLATVYLTKMTLPGMLKRGKGLIVNISSLGSYSFMPTPYMNIYGQTKAFINSFSENLLIECRSHPIDIVTLTPGFVDTKMCKSFKDHAIASNPPISGADTYAKSAIKGLSAGYERYSGLWFQGLYVKAFQFLHLFGLTKLLVISNTESHAREYLKSSPVMKRRRT